MADDNVVQIGTTREGEPPLEKRLYLTESPEETPHRVACVLRFLANVKPEPNGPGIDGEDENFGRHILLHDLATALDYSQAVRTG